MNFLKHQKRHVQPTARSRTGWAIRHYGAMDLLANAIQPYAWGSRSAIAGLQGREPSRTPEAELWMGAHPAAPSQVDRGGPTSLLDVIQAHPLDELGPRTLE